MIKHHPTKPILSEFVKGDLPASLSTAVSIHQQMCGECAQKIEKLTQQYADSSFKEIEPTVTDERLSNLDEGGETDSMFADIFESMIEEIVADDDIESIKVSNPKTVHFKDYTFTLPDALSHIELSKNTQLGKITRARLQLNEGEIHSSLLHIQPGGSVPEHTHKGYELTLLLDGEFTDEEGHYVAGDFIMLDGNNTHTPVSEKGCLCFTVANDALHFTQGVNRLLNPFGSFLY